MTKQEEIREEIDRTLFALEAGEISIYEAKQRLSSQGVVVKAPFDGTSEHRIYTTVEPLIKE